MDRRKVLCGVTAALAFGRSLSAQEKYPSRAVRIVVQYPPGGVTDLAARAVSEVMHRKYGQSVFVEHKPGASGLIGQQYVAGSRPDGYTLITGGLGGNVIPPVTVEGLPLDIVKALTPVAQVAEFVNVLVVRRDHPAKSLSGFISQAKGNRPMPYGTNGVGSSAHLTSEFFAMRTGLRLEPVPYKGSRELLVDVANGAVEFTFANLPAVVSLLQDGRLRALAVTSSYRSKHLRDVPTMQEAGVADFEVTSWLGIYAPSATPSAIVWQLGRDIAEGLAAPERRQRLEAAGFEARPLDSEGFERVNREELRKWSSIARDLGIKLKFGEN
ncbi:MAG: Bug family tripartite tricarboxylate transporter substrate binding protein [Burkholderiaceae bacterium]